MPNWKEALIDDCVALEAKRRVLLAAEESDEELVKLRRQSDALAVEITTLANEKFCNKIDDIDSKLENMHNQLKKKRDVDLIAGYIAHYDEKHSVVIKGVKDK